MKELRIDYYRYNQEDSMRRGEAVLLRNLSKFLILSNIVGFIQKAIDLSPAIKQ